MSLTWCSARSQSVMENIVGGDCQRWCEIASVVSCGRPVHPNNIVQHLPSHLWPNGSRWTHTHTHTHTFSTLESPACVSAANGLLRHYSNTHTQLHSSTPGSKPWTVNMFGPPSDRRLIQRECCKLWKHTHTHIHTSCPFLYLKPADRKSHTQAQ